VRNDGKSAAARDFCCVRSCSHGSALKFWKPLILMEFRLENSREARSRNLYTDAMSNYFRTALWTILDRRQHLASICNWDTD
jgi:hypothetical protein